MPPISLPDPFYIISTLVLLSLAPFVAIMVTSFIKMVVVLSLVRNALGIQQIPPNMVINGLAIILSLYVMAPIGQDVYDIARQSNFSTRNMASIVETVSEAKQPFTDFLMKHSNPRERAFFVNAAKSLWPENRAKDIREDNLLIVIPAFTVSELTSAFEIGFLLYLPFVVIDLVISNILLAMGMMMVSPMTISLPFKLLLFVLIEGWARLIHGLVLTYR